MKLLNFFKGWSFNRYFNLGIAIISGIYAISSKEFSFLILTVWLGLQAILNISCCGSVGCNTTPTVSKKQLDKINITVNYNEIN